MADPGGEAGLGEEPPPGGAAGGGGQLRVKHLEGEVQLERRIPRQVHGGGGPSTDLAQQSIAGGLDPFR